MKLDTGLKGQGPFRCLGIGGPAGRKFRRGFATLTFAHEAGIDQRDDLDEPVGRQRVQAFGTTKTQVIGLAEHLFGGGKGTPTDS